MGSTQSIFTDKELEDYQVSDMLFLLGWCFPLETEDVFSYILILDSKITF